MSNQRIICLSNVYDEHYHDARGERMDRCLSLAKRRDLFRCLEIASGRSVIVLSSPPKANQRRTPKWLGALETSFSTHRQLFCANWDLPKLRIVLAWFFYARHVLRYTRSGDIVVIDNYEFLYVLAAWWTRLFRRVTFVLDYEDGKHLSDRSVFRLLSGLAEFLGRPLIRAALLAHPSLGDRLPKAVPKELVPGFLMPNSAATGKVPSTERRFLYSGSLDRPRGVDLLLSALPLLPADGWHLDITGAGELADEVVAVAAEARLADRVRFHGTLPPEAFAKLVAECEIGLNCQKSADPISGVTFPSKVFTYLSAELVVLSSRASKVDEICGTACLYYEAETSEALAAAMTLLVRDFPGAARRVDRRSAEEVYSMAGTASRLRELFASLESLL